jgi:hypothetical protein
LLITEDRPIPDEIASPGAKTKSNLIIIPKYFNKLAKYIDNIRYIAKNSIPLVLFLKHLYRPRGAKHNKK